MISRTPIGKTYFKRTKKANPKDPLFIALIRALSGANGKSADRHRPKKIV
jgi:hypothetical protein